MVKQDKHPQQHAMSLLEQQKNQLVSTFTDVAAVMRQAAAAAESMAQMISDPKVDPDARAEFMRQNQALIRTLPSPSAPTNGPISPQSEEAMVIDPTSKGKKRGRPSNASVAAAAVASGHPAPVPAEKEKKTRKPKDPNAPKRPASAYILFQNDVRKEMQEKNPGMQYRDVLGEISKEWSTLDPERKAAYQSKVDQGKAVYNVQKAAYDIAHAIPGSTSAPAAPPAAAVQAETSPSAENESESSGSTDTSESGESESESSEEEEEQPPAHKKHKGPQAEPVAVHTSKHKK